MTYISCGYKSSTTELSVTYEYPRLSYQLRMVALSATEKLVSVAAWRLNFSVADSEIVCSDQYDSPSLTLVLQPLIGEPHGVEQC